jgi:hypothetical protein
MGKDAFYDFFDKFAKTVHHEYNVYHHGIEKSK